MSDELRKIDTNTFADFEIDLFEQGLDLLEAKSLSDKDALKKIHIMAGAFEKSRNVSGDHKEEIAEIVKSIKVELGLEEKKTEKNYKILREQLILLKAKLIMMRQSRAAEKAFDPDENEEKSNKKEKK